ncbi:MAG: hypothetical protein R2710_30055 [Acidimicrobiales bacterium]
MSNKHRRFIRHEAVAAVGAALRRIRPRRRQRRRRTRSRVGAPSAKAMEEIPASLLPVYMNAAAGCRGLPWQVLAAIGSIEVGPWGGTSRPADGRGDATDPPDLR